MVLKWTYNHKSYTKPYKNWTASFWTSRCTDKRGVDNVRYSEYCFTRI